MPRPYPPEFRRRALDLVESGRSIRDVAASLGIAESCLYRWRNHDLAGRGLKPGTTAEESAELAAARQRIRDLEEEVKILRKAAAAVEAVRPKDRYRLVANFTVTGCGSDAPAMRWRCPGRGTTPGPPGRRPSEQSGTPG
jgi:putative transposase